MPEVNEEVRCRGCGRLMAEEECCYECIYIESEHFRKALEEIVELGEGYVGTKIAEKALKKHPLEFPLQWSR